MAQPLALQRYFRILGPSTTMVLFRSTEIDCFQTQRFAGAATDTRDA